MISRIRKSLTVLDKYYQLLVTSPYYVLGVILTPNFRTKYFSESIKQHDIVQQRIGVAKEFWDEWRATFDDEKQAATSQAKKTSYDARRRRSTHRPVQVSKFKEIEQQLTWFTRPKSKDEWYDYTGSEPYDIQESPLQWWSNIVQQQRWPFLSKLALEILSIPAMSDEPERVFSGARRTISWERAQLGVDQVERMECLKHWMKSSICASRDSV
jgi:hypothetical protein